MNTLIDTWKQELLQLSASERAEIAHFLLETLDEPASGAAAAWDAEASRRVTEIRSGVATGKPARDVLDALQQQYP